jgi:hypothetical protein
VTSKTEKKGVLSAGKYGILTFFSFICSPEKTLKRCQEDTEQKPLITHIEELRSEADHVRDELWHYKFGAILIMVLAMLALLTYMIVRMNQMV